MLLNNMPRKLLIFTLLVGFLFSCQLTTKEQKSELVVCITFDDNYPSVIDNALPIMNQYNFRATSFVNSGLITNPFYNSWQNLALLKNQYGWEIGGHSLNHDNLALLSPEAVERVIKADYDSLNAHGFNPVSFATPFGICPYEYYPIIRKYYRNLRTIFDNPLRNPIDRFSVGCFNVTIDNSPQDVQNRINQAKLDNENLVVLLFHNITHGLTNNSNYEPDNFAEVMARLHRLNVKVLPLNEALKYLEN